MKSEYFQGSEKKTRVSQRQGLTVVKRKLKDDHEVEIEIQGKPLKLIHRESKIQRSDKN